MIKKEGIHKELKKYLVAKFGLGCLFVGTLLSTGVLAYLLFTDGITIGRLALLAVLMVISYIDGAFSGRACREIEELREEQTDGND